MLDQEVVVELLDLEVELASCIDVGEVDQVTWWGAYAKFFLKSRKKSRTCSWVTLWNITSIIEFTTEKFFNRLLVWVHTVALEI